MPATILYSACIASAIGLYLLMRGTRGGVRGMGTIIALGGLAWLCAWLHSALGTHWNLVSLASR